MVNQKELQTRIVSGFIFALLLLIPLYNYPLLFNSIIVVMVGWIIDKEIPLFYKPYSIRWLLILLYTVIPCTILLLLYNSDYRPLVGLAFLSTFCHDTAAYVAGRLWGKHLLCPRISPKKSWQGVLGGFLGVCALLAVWPYKTPISLPYLLLLAGSTTVSASAGDLFESWLKRQAHLKDAGDLIPGHGGILDRLDSLFAVILLISLLRNFLNPYF